MIEDKYEIEAVERLNNRFPGSNHHKESTIADFSKAIRRWNEKGEGKPPERWLINRFGG